MAPQVFDESLKLGTQRVEEVLGSNAIHDAKNASDDQHSETVREAIRKHWPAIMWSMVMSMSVVMEGYDTILMSSFFAYPSFARKYGQDYGGEIGWQLSGPWQTALNNASNIGIFPGIFLNGWLASKYGYRPVMMAAMAALNCFIFVTFFAPNKPVLVVGQILCGFSWGVFATIGPAYASEIVPLSLRGYLTSYVNLCWAIGQFIAAGVLAGLVKRTDQWGYRIPFAIQWVWPLPLMVLAYFAPESPWYKVRNDKLEDAQKILKRISSGVSDEDLNGTLAMMVHTTKIEDRIDTSGSYAQCFKGSDLRRTEVCCVVFVGQLMSGSCFAYTPTYFFQQAGISEDVAYNIGLGGTAVAFCGTIASWFLLARVGRRKLYGCGMAILCCTLMIIGAISAAGPGKNGKWVGGGLCVFWLLIYSLTVGPVAYTIVSETSSVRLRTKTVCLARNAYCIMNIVYSTLENYFMNPTEWDLAGNTAWFWFATSLIITVWCYFRLPEGMGRTYEELDLLFNNKVSARKFSSYEIDAYAGSDGSKVEIVEKN